MHVAEKTFLATAIYPRRANDEAARAQVANRLLADNLGTAVIVDWPRLVFNRVGLSIYWLACKGVLRAELNDFRANLARSFSQKSRAVDIDGLSFGRILLGLIDLDHCAIENQLRPHLGHTLVHSLSNRNIKLAVFECGNFVPRSQPTHQMAADQACGTRDQDLHHQRL